MNWIPDWPGGVWSDIKHQLLWVFSILPRYRRSVPVQLANVVVKPRADVRTCRPASCRSGTLSLFATRSTSLYIGMQHASSRVLHERASAMTYRRLCSEPFSGLTAALDYTLSQTATSVYLFFTPSATTFPSCCSQTLHFCVSKP